MKQASDHQPEIFWPGVLMRKLLNLNPRSSDYSADAEDENDVSSDSENEEYSGSSHGRESGFRESREDDDEPPSDLSDRSIPRVRKRRTISQTFRAQYIDSKEIRICVGTWNVGGKVPPDDLDIDDWIDMTDPADIYVFGLQEIVPLNAGNIFGAEDSRPVPKWENIIRDTLSRIRPAATNVKCYSDPLSPSLFKPSDDVPNLEEIIFQSDSDIGEEIYPLEQGPHGIDEFNNAAQNKTVFANSKVSECKDGSKLVVPVVLQKQFSTPKRLERLKSLLARDDAENKEAPVSQQSSKFTRVLSGIEQGPLGIDEFNNAAENKTMLTNSEVSECKDNSKLVVPIVLQRQFSKPKRLVRLKSLMAKDDAENVEAPVSQQNAKFTKVHSGIEQSAELTRGLSRTEKIGLIWPEPPLNLLPTHVLDRPTSFKLNDMPSGIALLAEIDLESVMKRIRRTSYVRIVSKQMVGVFLTIWVRRSLRRHIQNLNVSTVGVGAMGYIGNKGSISVSMSIYQTLFCFICTHLTSGEKDGDEHKRNSDVHDILRRTRFHSHSTIGLPRIIHDHERIIWLGDLNYRLNLPYDEARDLISKRDWSTLIEKDQLVRELRKGRTLDGWSEGALKFAPTYKYESNSDTYCGQDPKVGRRIPSWCDRILSYGKGMRQLGYRRTEFKLSDHRPVTAIYMAEVEVFCLKKLQRALTYTDAEIENEEIEIEDIEY